MLFHAFSSHEERRAYGGSAFLEIQLCTCPAGTKLKKLLSRVEPWKNDSLYVYFDDIDRFLQDYSAVFGYGVYENLNSRPLDPYGINYYAPSSLNPILERLHAQRHRENELLAEWLKQAEGRNGFYVLGI